MGIIGNIVGGIIGGNSAKSAADTQAQAAQQASAQSLAQYQQTRSDLAPYRDVGQTGSNALLEALGLPGGSGPNLLSANGINSLAFQPTQAQLASTPGYQFDLAQGLNGVSNSSAAKGQGISGAALKGAANYATGLANNTLGTQQGIFQANLNNVLSPLTGLTGLGEGAAAQTGQQGLTATQNANQALIGGANAQASGIVGQGNAITNAFNGAGSSLLSNSLLGNYDF